MPIYEYECLSCGIHFDEMQKVSDPPLTECRLCKGKVRKLLGTPALQFKGSGWYITDYAGKNAGNGKNGKEAGKPEGKAESAPKADEKKAAPPCACQSGNCGKPAK